MKKKLLILFFMVILLSGCNKNQPEITEEEEEPIVYETHMALYHYTSVDIYDSIQLLSLDDLETFEHRLSIFDDVLAQDLEWGTIRLAQSEAGSDYRFANDHLFTATAKASYLDTRTYVYSYKVADFSAYLTTSFHEDMQKLDDDLITADDIFDKYGTHVVMSVRSGYKYQMDLTIESRDLAKDEVLYIWDMLFNGQTLSLPIKDENYLTYEEKSRIMFTVKTSDMGNDFEDVLNNRGNMSTHTIQMFTEDDLAPLHYVFGFVPTHYPHAISQLETRYNELFSPVE